MAEPRLPALHAVTDDATLARAGFLSAARAVLAAGGPDVALHLRGPRAGGRLLWELAESLARAASDSGALHVVNDRVDVALAAGAGGVQLGRSSMTPPDVRGLVGGGPLIGVSVGSAREAMDAARGGADFVLAGSVYPTATHPGREGMGPAGLAEIAGSGIPTVAIG
ncbi:MAG TPA: thiamine phosphate synthase, partial [Longimicrobiaceae bacterium]|nr:thiamine phosphate synthase [Longimicrobiaceae bacterium]